MPTYLDPITTKKLKIDQTTIVYLVKSDDNTFSIKAISSGLNQLTTDPTSRSAYYWLIDTNKLLSEQLENPHIFIENVLTTGVLTSQQVQEFLGIDTNGIIPRAFDPQAEIVHQFHQQYAQHMDEHLADDEPDVVNWLAQHQNPHAFFHHLAAQAHQLGADPQAIEEAVAGGQGLFTAADIAGMDSNAIYALTQPECLQAMRPGVNGEPPFFTIADIAGMDSNAIHALTRPECLQAMRPGVNGEPPFFTIADIAGMDSNAIHALTRPECLQAMRPGVNGEPPLFTLADIAGMDANAIHALTQPECLQALRDGLLTIGVAANMTANELFHAMETGDFPQPPQQLNME